MKFKKYEFTFDKSGFDLFGTSVIRFTSKLEEILRLYTLKYLCFLGLISICRIMDNFVSISDAPSHSTDNNNGKFKAYHEFAIINKNFDYVPLGAIKTNKLYTQQLSDEYLNLNLDSLYKLTELNSDDSLLTFTKYEDACQYIDDNNLKDMFVIAIPYKYIENKMFNISCSFDRYDTILSTVDIENIDWDKYKDKNPYIIPHNDSANLKLRKSNVFRFVKSIKNTNVYQYIGNIDENKKEESESNNKEVENINILEEPELKKHNHHINNKYKIIDGYVDINNHHIKVDDLIANILNNGYRKESSYEKFEPIVLLRFLDEYLSGSITEAYVSDNCDIVVLIFEQPEKHKGHSTDFLMDINAIKSKNKKNKYLLLIDKDTINKFKIKKRNIDKVDSIRKNYFSKLRFA